MTRKLFWSDPYRTRLASRIAAVSGDEVTVAETIFYAFSGGQESDHGTIGGHPVLAARKAGQQIFYRLPSGHGLAQGADIVMTIDGSTVATKGMPVTVTLESHQSVSITQDSTGGGNSAQDSASSSGSCPTYGRPRIARTIAFAKRSFGRR